MELRAKFLHMLPLPERLQFLPQGVLLPLQVRQFFFGELVAVQILQFRFFQRVEGFGAQDLTDQGFEIHERIPFPFP